nr:hypothetical protein GCM10020092_029090 [Actinoplanes digitatis]
MTGRGSRAPACVPVPASSSCPACSSTCTSPSAAQLNRLLSAVALYPHELGLGIDEDTAILADGDCFEVLGSGAVIVVDAGAADDIRTPVDGPIALTGARVHVLPAGCRFELSGRRPSLADGAGGERELAA